MADANAEKNSDESIEFVIQNAQFEHNYKESLRDYITSVASDFDDYDEELNELNSTAEAKTKTKNLSALKDDIVDNVCFAVRMKVRMEMTQLRSVTIKCAIRDHRLRQLLTIQPDKAYDHVKTVFGASLDLGYRMMMYNKWTEDTQLEFNDTMLMFEQLSAIEDELSEQVNEKAKKELDEAVENKDSAYIDEQLAAVEKELQELNQKYAHVIKRAE